MRRMIPAVLAMLLGVGCAYLGGMAEREKIYGSAVPVIAASFASPHVAGGEKWRIYINASDPDGDMDQIFCSVDFQAGVDHPYPISITRIKPDQQKNLSGYLRLDTPDLDRPFNIRMTVQVRDKAGHFSAPVSFAVDIFDPSRQEKARPQESPPPGAFQDRDLGPIMIILTTEVG